MPVALPEDEVQPLVRAAEADPAGRVTVDLERLVLVAQDGREIPFEIEPDVRARLLEGLDDIGITLADAGLIDADERGREREGPRHHRLS